MMKTLQRSFRTPVRGHAFAARTPGTPDPAPGQLARLIREPGNPADEHAVGVWVADRDGRWRIGYLDRAVAARVAPRLDAGIEVAAKVDGWTGEPDGRWRRPVVVLLPATAPDEPSSSPDRPHTGSSAGPDRAAPERRPGVPVAVDPPPVARTGTGLWGRPPGVSRRVVTR